MSSFELYKICREFGSASAIISERGNVTYNQLAKYISGTCQNIDRSGIQQGETVAVLSGNSPEMVILLLALMQYGAVPIPMNIRLPVSEIQKLLLKLECKILILERDFPEIQDRPDLKQLSLKGLVNENTSAQKVQSEPIPFDQKSDIMFTSGSGGESKAAMHHLGNHIFSALGSNTNIKPGVGDRWLISLPLFHVGGLAIVFRCLLAGATMVISTQDRAPGNNIERYGITHVSLVGTQFYRLINDRTSSFDRLGLKAVLLGGGPISRTLITKAYKEEFPLFVSYGSTEMSSQITTTQKNDRLERLFTAGRVLPFREFKSARDGEIMVRGETLFDGYLREGKLDLELSNGWLATGDIGTVDPDGYLSLLGRKDNMFISGGENIHPEEIERILLEIPEVDSAIVVDVPDREYGARPFAFIHSIENLQEEFIRSFLSEHIPRYKIPTYFIIGDFDTVGLKTGRRGLRDKAISWLRHQSTDDK